MLSRFASLLQKKRLPEGARRQTGTKPGAGEVGGSAMAPEERCIAIANTAPILLSTMQQSSMQFKAVRSSAAGHNHRANACGTVPEDQGQAAPPLLVIRFELCACSAVVCGLPCRNMKKEGRHCHKFRS